MHLFGLPKRRSFGRSFQAHSPLRIVSLVSDTCAAALSDPLPVSNFWRVQFRFPSAPPLAWPQALTRMVIARRDWRQPRSATPSNCAGHAHARQLHWARNARARANPVAARLRSMSCDSSRATRLHAFLRSLHPETTRHTKPESLEIMLRLLIVALPLVVALPAAFDKQEVNALQFEAQSSLQFEVRSPPESRPLLPAAREINTRATPHTPLRAHNIQTHPSHYTRRGTGARARRSTPRSTLSPTSSSPGTPTRHRRCAPRLRRQPRMLQRAQLSVGPAAARVRERPVRML
jgi:hypothetical protein